MDDGNRALDLGWCVVRTLTAEKLAWAGRHHRRVRPCVLLAAHAGLSLRAFNRLSEDRKRDLWHGSNWLLRPDVPPRVGTVINA